ncbi:TrlF family AAA-like ATPase [Pseudomonas sp. 22082]|uniref:TrlF family AAA-like ATPase n=1 Tax=Pseudomonas sp. 22082 TaxID=3453868 RepID=UPI003F86AFF7
MTDEPLPPLNSGSRWLRWEPHVHAPGTLFSDQFRGNWEDYLSALESASPTINAIAVTDYYLLDTYRAVCKYKSDGRLPACDLIFPNVELRLDIGTAKSWVNAHLLISPEQPNHIEEIERFLSGLTFGAFEDEFRCTPSDLIRLGRKADESIENDHAALKHGAERFKVSFKQLRMKYEVNEWAQNNILIAVAAKQNDGTSALREGADEVLRMELEGFAHIIFASNPNQREYWLGRKNHSPEEIKKRYKGLKPCLHGCDAHSVPKTARPDDDRFSWIKGAATFDTLRQACIDPEGRAFVGEAPPPSAMTSETLSRISINGAPWLKTPNIELNPGLVAIIGARGSGKTALADMIAAACDAHAGHVTNQSFLLRAQEHLEGASATVTWQNGDIENRDLSGAAQFDYAPYQRARYLSQQFVEKLCSADGMTDGLLSEVERVIFDAHTVTAREGAVNFSDLREIRSARHRQARKHAEESLSTLSERINVELEKRTLVASYKAQAQEKEQLINRLNEDRSKLVAKGSESRVARLEELTKAAETVNSYIRYYINQENQLLLMQDEVANVRTVIAPEDLREIKERHAASKIGEAEWETFFRDFKGDVDEVLQKMLESAQRNKNLWTGTTPPPNDDPELEFIANDADLKKLPLAVLRAEIERIGQKVSIDKETSSRFTEASKKITAETELLRATKEKLEDYEGAASRLEGLLKDRDAAYERVFASILSEQQVLAELYAPIRSKLEAASGTLKKLSFSITRTVDIDAWAVEGEALLNLTKKGPFRGKGALKEIAGAFLREPWLEGTQGEVMEAMRAFKDAYQKDLLAHSPVVSTDPAEYRRWAKKLAQWLYGTDHINIQYAVNYDNIDIKKLSPGTRGIVLLLLYLSLDDGDTTPLIIDQPEENLDPKSINDDLVPLFLGAKTTRQVIIVTHNANLVINTDADQIIIASSGTHISDGLPPITYVSGGLEDKSIRGLVCEILEGGEIAFKERARRLRVRLSR